MGWSDWPYWLKGGVILSALGGILIISYFFYLLTKISFFVIPGLIPVLTFYVVYDLIPNWVIAWILTPIIYFLLGALIGWLYGKYKERNSSESNS